MDAHNLFVRLRLQSQGIGVPQVSLPGEGKLLKILLALDSVNVNIFEFFFIETGF